jgi:hypothetical protein
VKQTIEIFDLGAQAFVEAELFDEVTLEDFLVTQLEWRPQVLEATRELARRRLSELLPGHFHWDWTRKAPELELLAVSFFGIRCGGRLQGLMKIETVGHQCRLAEQQGKPLVYIDYLETAPWNVKPLMQALNRQPQFGGVGSRLVEAAVRRSLDEEFRGRVGLHALPTSERFYLEACGMTPVGRDPAKQNLLWCEFTPEQAEAFLTKGAP